LRDYGEGSPVVPDGGASFVRHGGRGSQARRDGAGNPSSLRWCGEAELAARALQRRKQEDGSGRRLSRQGGALEIRDERQRGTRGRRRSSQTRYYGRARPVNPR
jgi:hypothetical protein